MTKEDEDKFTAQLLDAFTKVVEAIQAGGNRKGVSGSIVCPRCGNSLRWSADSFGHTVGACTTEGCLAWVK